MPRTSRSLQSVTLSLGLVHNTCGSGVKRQYVCVDEDIPVEDDDLSRAGTLARGKSYLVAVRPSALGMVMHTLHHAEEVHVEDQVPHGEPGRVSAPRGGQIVDLLASLAARRAKSKRRSSSS